MVATLRARTGVRTGLFTLVPLLLCSFIVLFFLGRNADHSEQTLGLSRSPLSESRDTALRWENYIENVPNFSDRSAFSFGKRDVCSAAIAGSVTSYCTPSNTTQTTLCCVHPATTYPLCAVILDEGFCCVSDQGNCYTDTASVCDFPNSVPCPGLDGVCCPQYTDCAPNQNATAANVRCQLNSISLSSVLSPSTSSTSSSTSSSAASSTTSSTSSSAASTTAAFSTITANSASVLTSSGGQATGTSSPSSNGPPGKSISNGAIAGIAIGATAGIIIAGLVGWWCARHRKTSRKALPGPATNPDDGGDARTGLYPKHEMEVPSKPRWLQPPQELESYSNFNDRNAGYT